MPGLNDIAHTYTFYLFKQPANFTLPAYDAGRDYNPISVYARMNFSVEAVANVAGAPVAANYIRVQNPNNNATGTAPNTTSTASASATTSSTVTYSTPAAILELLRGSLLVLGFLWALLERQLLLCYRYEVRLCMSPQPHPMVSDTRTACECRPSV